MVAMNRISDALADCEQTASTAAAAIDALTVEQQERLSEQLDRYLVGLEHGTPLDAAEIVREHPDIGDVFRAYLEKLHALYGVTLDVASEGHIEHELSIQSLGDFRIGKPIGRGGMGIVFEATQVSLRRRVAIKLLPLTSMLDETQVARFQNEARAAGLLQHPHIVPVYNVGSESGVHYYAMQFIDGISMDDWVEQSRGESEIVAGYRPWKTVVSWAADIADALQTAHANGVIHRDVKPSNLMVDAQSKIWIADFGLARCQSDVSLTGSGDLLGTVRYMSPEQASGKSALVDGRCDVYSLAVTLYELLTLQPAFDADSVPEVLRQIDENRVVPLRHVRPDLPRDLETVLCKAMCKDRDGRYETAADLHDDLRRVINGEPTVARPPTLIDHAIRFGTRHLGAVLITLVVLTIGTLALSVATVTFASLKQNADNSTRRAEQKERLAREAVGRLGAQTAELLADISAAQRVRQRLLNETLAYYKQFVVTAQDDPTLRHELAVTFGKIGSLHSELGDLDHSLQNLRESERLFQQLVKEDPDNADLEADWAAAINNLGESLTRAGQYEQSGTFYARAVRVQRELLDKQPTSVNQRRLATTLNNMGLMLSEVGATEEAVSTYERALQLVDRCDPNETDRHLLRASILRNLSSSLTEKEPLRAAALARRALEQQLDALREDPSDAKWAVEVVVTLNKLAAAQAAAAEHQAALESLQRAVEVGEQLVARLPDQPGYARNLLATWNQIGVIRLTLGKHDSAAEAFTTAMRYGRDLVAGFDQHAETQSTVASVLNNQGFLYRSIGDRDRARGAFAEAIERQSHAVELAPTVNRYRSLLRQHRENLEQVSDPPGGYNGACSLRPGGVVA